MAFNSLKIKQRVEEIGRLQYIKNQKLDPIVAHAIEEFGNDKNETQIVLREGERWGQRDTLYQMDFIVEIPQVLQGQMVALRVDLSLPIVNNGPINTVEGLMFINGKAFHAIDRYHREVILPATLSSRKQLEITIRAWTGIDAEYHTVYRLELSLIDENIYKLHSLMSLMLEALEHLNELSPSYYEIANALEEAVATLDFRNTGLENFSNSCADAYQKLGSRLQKLSTQFPASSESNIQPHSVAVGHAHIDVAWLWRLRHTRIKAADTFSTALYHMERYPYFTFTQSQPQLYQFVKEDQPELYARIKQKVAEGQWEPEGAMWVEADTNITGAESLVRQFLFGQRFFEKEFGYRCKVLWLPDVFGYSAALPQLIKGAGAEYFITSKISWNDTNRMPADTFWWQGLDGTKVLTYFLTAQNDDVWPAYTYNAEMDPGVLARTWKNYRQKDVNRETLVAYGFGDGGGGPTRKMIEAVETLNQPFSREIPSVSSGKVADFMKRLEKQVGKNPELPRWVGELYLEYHRGTYTSQGRTKRNNRNAEKDLHHAEYLASTLATLTGSVYPRIELNRVWQIVLTHQFHDIIPGSSIGEVYSDAERNYAAVREVTDEIISESATALANKINVPASSLIVFNSLSWERNDLLELEEDVAVNFGLPVQKISDGRALVKVSKVPALGYQSFTPETNTTQQSNLKVSPRSLESDFYLIELNEKGQISRLLDKQAGREVLADGERGNVFQLFEDKPVQYDAWDIDNYYEQKSWELDNLADCQVIEQGPLRAGLKLEWQYSNRTRITQNIYIYSDNRRIDFVTEVDWQERQTLLKVAWPVAIHNGRATADIQFGNIERPTHRNTSWDQARFETSAHKWFDLSEGDFGVSILNDCKYGYDVHDNVMRQTLLKGAISPDPLADLGKHKFVYSLLPHKGGWFEGGAHLAAYELNNPLSAVVKANVNTDQDLPPSWSLARVESVSGSVILETVKLAEDDDNLILRLYECANRRGSTQIHLPFALENVLEVNLLEEEISTVELSKDGKSFYTSFKPYQIKTFKLIKA